MMSRLNPNQLQVTFLPGTSQVNFSLPRVYTLTHSDSSGELFLTIGDQVNQSQIDGWYTRLMRDEVVAKWERELDSFELHVHSHVSGGLVIGSARWRYRILQHHMPQVIQSFRYGDRAAITENHLLDQAIVLVHFHARQQYFDKIENWGELKDFVVSNREMDN